MEKNKEIRYLYPNKYITIYIITASTTFAVYRRDIIKLQIDSISLLSPIYPTIEE